MATKTQKSRNRTSHERKSEANRIIRVTLRLPLAQHLADFTTWLQKNCPKATIRPLHEKLLTKVTRRRFTPLGLGMLEHHVLVHVPEKSFKPELVRDIGRHSAVEHASLEKSRMSYSQYQVYRKGPDDGGINANAVLGTPTDPGPAGAKGDGVKLQVITRGWLTHVDLGVPADDGTAALDEQKHGLTVLGILSAAHRIDYQGILGLVPNATLMVPKQFHGVTDDEIRTSLATILQDIVTRALGAPGLDRLEQGDVLLVDAFTACGLPVELYDDVFDKICVLTALGITVVLPAGDLALSLGDELPNRYSGALIVGASDTTLAATGFTNYGARIDFFSLGMKNGVMSLAASDGYGFASINSSRWSAAVIAGAVVAVQGMHYAKFGTRLPPARVREALLHDRQDQTTNVATNPVGKLPNLSAIWDAIDTDDLPMPDIFIHDSLGDTGEPYAVRNQYMSPDIITKKSNLDTLGNVIVPKTDFSDPDGLVYSETIEWGQTNYVYVRIHNRGSVAATAVQVKLYWACPSVSSGTKEWSLIGEAVIPTIAAADHEFATIPWNVDSTSGVPQPASGGKIHTCFIATAGCEQDPIFSWKEAGLYTLQFHDMANASNNIAWRNFDIEDANTFSSSKVLEVFVPGRPQAMNAAIRFDANLPVGAKLELDLPQRLTERLIKAPEELKPLRNSKWSRLPLAVNGRAEPLSIKLDEREAPELVKLRVQIPARFRDKTYDVSIAHLAKGRVIGRFTFRIKPRARTH